MRYDTRLRAQPLRGRLRWRLRKVGPHPPLRRHLPPRGKA
nr:MAG TPA: hypothetical protein [Caudoviricetes sp.]